MRRKDLIRRTPIFPLGISLLPGLLAVLTRSHLRWSICRFGPLLLLSALSFVRYVLPKSLVGVVDELPTHRIVCPQRSNASAVRRRQEVAQGRIVTITWGLETPRRHQSPGRLGEAPAEGPPSRYSVEERLHGVRPGVGWTWSELESATAWDLYQENWVNAMLDEI